MNPAARNAAQPSSTVPERSAGARTPPLRGFRSLRELEDVSEVSRSSLSRYENSAPMPVKTAEHLDEVLNAKGWLFASVSRLRESGWTPWTGESSACTFEHRWPAPYSGPVWIHLVPEPGNVGRRHTVVLLWGPWRRDLTATLVARGLVLVTGKSPDKSGVGVACRAPSSARSEDCSSQTP